MRILLILLCLIFLAQTANAKVWVLVNKETREILSVSPADDAQIPNDEYEKIIVKGEYQDLIPQLQYSAQDYKYKNGRFVLNVKKLSDEAVKQEEWEEKAKEDKFIKDRMRKIARDQLVGEGMIKE